MTAPDELHYDRAAPRIGRVMMVIAALGTVLGFALGGWPWGGGFLLGACISLLNYRWMRNLVEALGTGKRPRGAVFLAFRYLLFGAGAYVILRYSPLSTAAVLSGLFVMIAAVFVELVFELIYGRNRIRDNHLL